MSLDRPLALTQGDPAGIGPDITLAAWLARDSYQLPPFLYLGDPAVLTARANLLGLDVPLREADTDSALSVFSDALPVLPIAAGADVAAGEPHVATARGTISAIEQAVALSLSGKAAATVTNPISKSILYQAGFGFPGHTEFLADLAEKATGARIWWWRLAGSPTTT
jgi:4-hydroxythreonine-4-phosphate dehydrogenase